MRAVCNIMANKVTGIVKLGEAVVAGTGSGDLLLWDMEALLTKVDERLQLADKKQIEEKSDEFMTNSEDSDTAKCESAMDHAILELPCTQRHVNPFTAAHFHDTRVSINHLCSLGSVLLVSHSKGASLVLSLQPKLESRLVFPFQHGLQTLDAQVNQGCFLSKTLVALATSNGHLVVHDI
jgi:hypothetical protein